MTGTLVGVDIGFSERDRTNAIAVLRDSDVSVRRYSVAERNEVLASIEADVIAIDAPILPIGTPPEVCRRVERTFIRGLFQRRCKPGMSHVAGTGRLLRRHGNEAADHVRASATNASYPLVREGKAVVEAFPNTFLGVLIDASTYDDIPRLSRGRKKFRWLYEQAVGSDAMSRLVARLGLPAAVEESLRNEKDHECRAALVCLVTAGSVFARHFTAVGHPECGYFFLPPLDVWAPWARDALQDVRGRVEGSLSSESLL